MYAIIYQSGSQWRFHQSPNENGITLFTSEIAAIEVVKVIHKLGNPVKLIQFRDIDISPEFIRSNTQATGGNMT